MATEVSSGEIKDGDQEGHETTTTTTTTIATTIHQPKRPLVIPTVRDILCGRGSTNFNHEGNGAFRKVILSYLPAYRRAGSKAEKSDIIRMITNRVIQEGKGRFLKNPKESVHHWYVASPKEAYEKVGIALRDAANDRRGVREGLEQQQSVVNAPSDFEQANQSNEENNHTERQNYHGAYPSYGHKYTTGPLHAPHPRAPISKSEDRQRSLGQTRKAEQQSSKHVLHQPKKKRKHKDHHYERPRPSHRMIQRERDGSPWLTEIYVSKDRRTKEKLLSEHNATLKIPKTLEPPPDGPFRYSRGAMGPGFIIFRAMVSEQFVERALHQSNRVTPPIPYCAQEQSKHAAKSGSQAF